VRRARLRILFIHPRLARPGHPPVVREPRTDEHEPCDRWITCNKTAAYLVCARPCERHCEIAERSGRCYPEHVLLRSTQIGKINGHRLCPSEQDISGQQADQRNDDGTDQINVTQGIQTDAAGGVSRQIAEMFRDVTMRCFVKRNGKQYRQRKDSEFLNGAKLQPVLR